MQWRRVTRAGTLADQAPADGPGKGLWIASMRVPYTDDQGTLEFHAVDGVIMFPRFCCNGQQRDSAFRSALRNGRP